MEENKENNINFNDIAPEELKGLFGEDDPLAQWAFFLEMPEDQFNLFAPLVLEETEKELSKDETRMALAQQFNIKGFKIEDIEEAFTQLNEIVDKEFANYS